MGAAAERLTVPCAACGRDVDPLRAGRAAAFDDGFRYFCDAACREAWDGGARAPAPTLAPGDAAAGTRGAGTRAAGEPAPPSLPPPDDPEAALATQPEPLERRPALVLLALTAGTLAVAAALAGASLAVEVLRVALALLGFVALAVRETGTRRDPADLGPVALLAPPLAAIVLSLGASVARDAAAADAVLFAGLAVATTALGLRLVERARRPLAAERARLAALLRAPGRAEPGSREVPAAELRAGETVIVEAGEVIPVDGRVVSGEATVVPWAFAAAEGRRREGDSVVAGARVVAGRLGVVATFGGRDRAWARLALDRRRRADAHASLARLARGVATRGALASLALGALAAFVNGQPPVRVALAALAAHVAVGTVAVASVPSIHLARGLLASLRRGIAHRSAEDWDRASGVSSCVFCARGTLLLGEPQLSDLETVGGVDEARVLALAAGTQAGGTHPLAAAILRAASSRGLAPDPVRSPQAHLGLGVTAIASSGESLAVGNRALLLRERVSFATSEPRINEIESHGRTVQLVAVGGRLAGILGLQDALRPGARAAVQNLLDVHVEPVLLSGDARETCEAIGRALDIEHLRPEVVPADRGREVQRLEDGGAVVAVIGHPKADDAALAAASVSIALASAGDGAAWSVSLASDEVRDAALAVALAHRARTDARTALALALAPGLVGALTVSFGLVPAAWFAPLAALVGVVASTLHARAFETGREE